MTEIISFAVGAIVGGFLASVYFHAIWTMGDLGGTRRRNVEPPDDERVGA